MEQTIAQAVEAAAAQQQQQQASPAVASIHGPPSSAVDNLTCQWQGCGERCDSAESLYDHVCERHVGRKSTNNLNLTCQWGACRTTTVKRDHITSHIRVHVPLKPHKCDFCGKAFKRPQDLKKHVKTHADDSVLTNSPGQGSRNMGANGGAGRPDGNGFPGYGYAPAQHDGGMGAPYSNYQSAMSNGNGYSQPANNHYSGYGSVSYPTSAGAQEIQSMDTRRRAIEALNDFLGDIKRRAIDPSVYYDVGSRLQSSALPLPVGNGYNTGYSNPAPGYSSNYNTASLLESFNNGNSMGGGLGVATQNYSLPLPNARTKNDLQEIDRFLEQLQATVYETSNHAAMAGIQQPGVHTMHTGEWGIGSNQQSSYRSSHSPPNHNSSTAGAASANNMGGNLNMASTPGSETSYTSSSHSPMSSASHSSLSSLGSYPALPAVTRMSDLGSYPATTSAPAAGLASDLDSFGARPHRGGQLQRQAPAPSEDTAMAEEDDGSRTPRPSDVKKEKKELSTIDPALRGEGEKSPSDSSSTPADDKRAEEWVENVRVIEALKKWVSDRLKNGEYEQEEGATDAKPGAERKSSMSEIAKLVEQKLQGEAKEEKMADVTYPTLPAAS